MNELNTIAHFCKKFMHRKVDLPIRSSDMGLLIFIDRNYYVTSKEACAFFDVSKPMVAAMVKRLRQASLLYTTIDKQDKRVHYLELTEKGKSFVDESKKTYHKFIKNLQEEMGQENFDALATYIGMANEAMKRMAVDE